MRVPNFRRYIHWLASLGLFLSGMIVGCAVFLSIYQQNFTILATQKADLENEVRELQSTIETAEKNHKKAAYIGGIFVEWENRDNLDDLTRIELEKRVHKDLSVLSGKPIADIRKDPLLFFKLIEKPYTNVHDRNYEVRVAAMLIVQSELRVWIRASLTN